MKRIITCAVIFLCLLWTSAFAETSIKAQVNKTIITTDELLTYKLTITSSEKQLPQPEMPGFDGFKAVSSSQQSNISFIKGQMQTQISFGFALASEGVGKFKIEPAKIKINNQTYATAAFEIEVKQGKRKLKVSPEQKPSEPLLKKSRPESEAPQITL